MVSKKRPFNGRNLKSLEGLMYFDYRTLKWIFFSTSVRSRFLQTYSSFGTHGQFVKILVVEPDILLSELLWELRRHTSYSFDLTITRFITLPIPPPVARLVERLLIRHFYDGIQVVLIGGTTKVKLWTRCDRGRDKTIYVRSYDRKITIKHFYEYFFAHKKLLR